MPVDLHVYRVRMGSFSVRDLPKKPKHNNTKNSLKLLGHGWHNGVLLDTFLLLAILSILCSVLNRYNAKMPRLGLKNIFSLTLSYAFCTRFLLYGG